MGLNAAFPSKSMVVYVKCGNQIKGQFNFIKPFRNGIQNIFQALQSAGYSLVVLSGDHSTEKSIIENLVDGQIEIYFQQTPSGKKKKMEALQNRSLVSAVD